MRLSLLPLLFCPSCGRKIRLVARAATKSGDQIVSGSLVCLGRHYWPIVGGVPRFVRSFEPGMAATAFRFGDQWSSYSVYSQSDEKQFLNWIYPVGRKFFIYKIVLDAGCGSGRHLLLTNRFAPKVLIGIDLSRAVDLAYSKTKELPNVHIIQADILNLPFEKPFDYIYSVGVLHHLPSPKTGFRSLVVHLKTKGAISSWVYGKEGNEVVEKIISPLRRFLTSHLPPVFLVIVSIPLAIIVYLTAKVIKFLPKDLPLHHYVSTLRRYSWRKIFLIVYDQLNAPTAYYLARAEVKDFTRGLKLKGVVLSHRLGNSWSIFAQKP